MWVISCHLCFSNLIVFPLQELDPDLKYCELWALNLRRKMYGRVYENYAFVKHLIEVLGRQGRMSWLFSNNIFWLARFSRHLTKTHAKVFVVCRHAQQLKCSNMVTPSKYFFTVMTCHLHSWHPKERVNSVIVTTHRELKNMFHFIAQNAPYTICQWKRHYRNVVHFCGVTHLTLCMPLTLLSSYHKFGLEYHKYHTMTQCYKLNPGICHSCMVSSVSPTRCYRRHSYY